MTMIAAETKNKINSCRPHDCRKGSWLQISGAHTATERGRAQQALGRPRLPNSRSRRRAGLAVEFRNVNRCPLPFRRPALGVRRGKAALSSGCKPHPAIAPAGSNRSSHGGNEVAEAFDWRVTNWGKREGDGRNG